MAARRGVVLLCVLVAAAFLFKNELGGVEAALDSRKLVGFGSLEQEDESVLEASLARRPVLTPEAEHDLVRRLPGQPHVDFRQFAGYVTVNESSGRNFFYWHFEAEGNANAKPLLLWLNGGPGCSSVAFGASEELGPFRINSTADSLYRNHHSWNRLANLLFVESPAGVGFSYSHNTHDYVTGDAQTAADNLQFVLRWFERFPQYRNRDFYISGESYAGHYVPQLARLLYEYNSKQANPTINFKGFLVGNAVTDNLQDNVGTVDYWWTHALISDETHAAILASCNFSANATSDACNSYLDQAINVEFGNIDMYSIYTPVCNSHSSSNSTTRPRSSVRATSSSIHRRLAPLRHRLTGYDPCSEDYAEIYYNRLDVQQALHVTTTTRTTNWTACNMDVNDNWQDSEDSILPTYQELIAAGLRIWVFSGDTDAVVPVTATRYSLNKLNLTIATPWYPWYLHGQVGGWTQEYAGLTFVTTRGAGHEVPDIKPSRAFELARRFLHGVPLSNSTSS